jgi:hypothetical protein
MYDQPPPYSGIFQPQEQHLNRFDEKSRVTNGFIDPNDPSKVYVPSAPKQVNFQLLIKNC